ncbi:MAG: hypothetical protein JNM70_16280 [Anaerolineae bacterium]|nr:hypothetical protein [Anaerolineae bacterium]
MRRMLQWALALLIGAAAGGVFMAAAQEPSGSVLADCVKLLPADRPIPTGPDAPALRIIQPTTEVVYGRTVTITIQSSHFDIPAEGRHWHLWVNGQLQGMVYQPAAVIDLEPGTYQICASLGNTDHADLGMPDGISLRVEAALAGTPTATLGVAREQAQVQPEPGIGLGQILVLVAGGLLAAVGGWWLGSRLPKQRKSTLRK